MSRADRLRQSLRYLLQKQERAIAARIAGEPNELAHAYQMREGAIDAVVDAVEQMIPQPQEVQS